MKLLRDQMTYAEAEKALADPDAYMKEQKRRALVKNRIDGKSWPGRYRWCGKIHTARMTVAYCWGVKRNTAGFFLGWREVYGKDGKVEKRDQFIARKSKKRLSLLQNRRTMALKGKVSC